MVSLALIPIPDFSQKSLFNKCLQVSLEPGSFYISFIYSVLFSISKHRKSDLGKSLYTTLYTYLSKSSSCTYLLNLLNRFKDFDESFSSENLLHLVRTEGALIQLLNSSVQLCKILTNSSGSAIEPISSSQSSTRLEMISSGLNVTLAIIMKNEVKYWNRKNGNLIIWTYEDNSSHFALIPCLGLSDNEFPFVYKETNVQIFEYSKEKFEISDVFDWVHLRFKGLDATLENFLGLAAGMMFVFGKKESRENGQYFINKLKEIVENFEDTQGNETLTFFIQYFEYLMSLEGDIDIFLYLDNSKEHIWYLASALKIAGQKLLLMRGNSVSQDFVDILNVLSQVLNISFAIYTSELKTIKTYFKKQEVWIYLREYENQYLPLLYLNKVEINNKKEDTPPIIVQSIILNNEDSANLLSKSINPTQSELFPDPDPKTYQNSEVLHSSPAPEASPGNSTEPLNHLKNTNHPSSLQSNISHQPNPNGKVQPPSHLSNISYQPNPNAKVQPPSLLSSSRSKPLNPPAEATPSIQNPKVQIESSNPTDPTSFNPPHPDPDPNPVPNINFTEITSDLMALFKPNYLILKPKLQSLNQIQDIYNSIASKPISSSQALLNHFLIFQCNNLQHLQIYFSLMCTHTFCIECLFESLGKFSFYSCPQCKIFLKEKTKKKIYAEIAKLRGIKLPKAKKIGIMRNFGNVGNFVLKKCVLCKLQLMDSEFAKVKCKFECCVCMNCRRASDECLNCREIEKKILEEEKGETEICAVCNEFKDISSFGVQPCANKCRVCWQCRDKETECAICKIREEDDKNMLLTIRKRKNEDETRICFNCNKNLESKYFPEYCEKCIICIYCALNTQNCISCSTVEIFKYKNRCPTCSKDIKTDELEILQCQHYYHKKCVHKGKQKNCYCCRHGMTQSEIPNIP